MERFGTATTLTSSETAELLDVHPSTIKRWCNDGELAFATTPGGHRRIRIDDAVALADRKDIPNVLAPFHPYEAHVWKVLRQIREEGSFKRLHTLAMGWVGRGHLRRVSLLFDAVASHTGVGLSRFCDEAVGGFMKQVGEEWARGRLRVGEEHLVSQTMTEVLLKLRARLADDPTLSARAEDPVRGSSADDSAPVAVVGTLEGNHHGLGALCVRLVLESEGWKVFFLGPDVPAEDFALIQRGREASLVCISMPYGASTGSLAKTVRGLSGLYDPSLPYALAFGGSGTGDAVAVGGPFANVGIFSSCAELAESLASGFTSEVMAAR